MKRHRPRLLALGAALVALLLALFVWRWGVQPAPTVEERSALGAEGARGSAFSEWSAADADAAVASAADAGPRFERSTPPLRLARATVRRDGAAVGTIAGRVVALASGRGVPGASLTFGHADRAESITSDAEGAFRFAPSRNGTYVLAVVSAEGFLPFAPEWGQSPLRFEIREGAHVEGVLVTLVDAVTYVVEVHDAEGPVAGAAVQVHGAESGERTLVPLLAHATTDVAGEARVHAPDGSVIEARHARGTGRGAIDAAAQVTHRVRITLSAVPPASLRGELTIAGVVRNRAGAAVEGASVVATHQPPAGATDRELHPPLVARTGTEGAFELAGADEGEYRLVVRHAEHATAHLRAVAAGSTGLEIVLEDEALLRAHVVDDATGEALPAATVLVERPVGPLVSERVGLEAGYDPDGWIEVRGLPAGPARLLAAAPDHATSAPVDVELTPGRSQSVELRLTRGGALSGRVTSEDGTPLAGARVTLESGREPGASAAPLERSVLTGEEGAFELAGITAGVRSIVVWAGGHHGRLRSGLVVVEGVRTDAGTIDLRPTLPGETPRLELAGIGVVLQAEADVLVVGRVVEGGGAAAAGLVAGDAIVAIAGEPVVGLGFEACIERLRGPEGTTVVVTVRHEDGREETLVVPRWRIRA